jgi:hypothetical protein
MIDPASGCPPDQTILSPGVNNISTPFWSGTITLNITTSNPDPGSFAVVLENDIVHLDPKPCDFT